MIGYFAPENFEPELLHELGHEPVAKYGRLILSQDSEARDLTWSHNTWLTLEKIDIASIGDAAKKLRSLAKDFGGLTWVQTPLEFHRRAALIEEQLPTLKKRSFEFLEEPPTRYGSWGLIEQNLLLASAESSSLFPNGEIQFNENKEAPSRAYLKLWELFTVYGVRPKAGDVCVDFGACPGGWTWVLAKMGCNVLAIDRSPLAPQVAKMKNVEFRKGNVFTLKPSEVGAVDWVFSDVICYPKDLADLVDVWRESALAQNFVCTIKFQGKTDFGVIERLSKIPGSRVKHLFHNKHEVTWWLTREQRVQN